MLNIPNILTISRILLSPFIAISILKAWKTVTFVLFTIAGFTDLLDGFFARRLKSITRLGTILDPVADKILIFSTLIPALITRLIPLWVGVVFISKDFLISFAILVLYLIKKPPEITPTLSGKTAIFLEGSYITFVLFSETIYSHALVQSFIHLLTVLSVTACVIALFSYIPAFTKSLRNSYTIS